LKGHHQPHLQGRPGWRIRLSAIATGQHRRSAWSRKAYTQARSAFCGIGHISVCAFPGKQVCSWGSVHVGCWVRRGFICEALTIFSSQGVLQRLCFLSEPEMRFGR